MKRSFHLLNFVQFVVAMNENILKSLVAYFLISLNGSKEASCVMSMTGGLFILPFILFSTLGGTLADKLSKQKITLFTKIADTFILLLALISFHYQSETLSYFVLFLLSTSSALFGPSKYGIIPEIVEGDHLLKANSFIACFTFLAVILGTALASFFAEYLSFTLGIVPSMILALATIAASFYIERTAPMNPKKAWTLFPIDEWKETAIDLKKSSRLWLGFFCFAYFIFIGAFTQINIVPYAINSLGLKDVDGGYLFSITALGIGLGSLFAKRTTLFLPIILMLISLFLLAMGLFSPSIPLAIISLGGLGLLGGLFLVPSQFFLMSESKFSSRGRNFGSANLLSFVFALLAAAVVYLLGPVGGYSAQASFVWVSLINFGVAGFVFYLAKGSKR